MSIRTGIRWTRLVILVLILFSASVQAGVAHRIIWIPELDAREALSLRQAVPGLLMDRVDAGGVRFYARASALRELEAMGVDYLVLWEDERDRAREAVRRDGRAWPETTHAEMLAWMQGLASSYPSIARYHLLGSSIQGRDIVALEITDQPDLDDPGEPEVRMQGNIHGDEYMSLELMCLLAEDLCTSYGTDPEVTGLVDDLEIWVIPSVNPDGHENGTRSNVNGVDLNRNHGYMWVGGYGHGSSSFSEQELRVWYENALLRNYCMSLSFHGEASYFNYPWNFTGRDAPDKSLLIQIGNGYSALENGYTVIEGWDWYQTNGDTNDWSYGARGDLDVTLETPGYSSSAIATDWDDNREAMLYFMGEARYGLTGVVTDASSGEPLPALIRIVEKERWPTYTDSLAGDYHRPISAGTYTLEVWANAHETEILSNVSVTSGQTTQRDVALSRASTAHAFQIAWSEVDDYYETHSSASEWQWDGWLHDALGPPDDYPGSLGRACELCLDMGEGFEIQDVDGDDFSVIEADVGDGTESCSVYAGNQPWGPWTSLGSATGTTAFDLSGTGLVTVRYLRFLDDGDGAWFGGYPGYDLDAVTHDFGDPGCGVFELERVSLACQDDLDLLLLDEDLNTNPGTVETATVHAHSDSDPTGLDLELTETGSDTGGFAGLLSVASEAGTNVLEVAEGDQVILTYQDADCEGAPATLTVLLTVDCTGPVITDGRVETVTETTALVEWTTDEPADSTVRFGVLEPSETTYDPGLVTEHTLLLTDLDPCTGYIFEIGSTDEAGNETWDDRQGAYYGFATTGRTLLLDEDMSSNPGWGTTGDWAWGVPQGNQGDPSSGHTGSEVFGYNLSGSYTNNLPEQYLTTGSMDCSQADQVTLSFWRWLGVETSSYDHASVEVSSDGGSTWSEIWSNPASDLTDTEWTYQEHDLSAQAAGQPDVRLRWVMGSTDYSIVFCGWNVDDVQVSVPYDCPSPTPRPTWTSTPAVTPTPTPEPTPEHPLGVRLDLPSMVHPGEPFYVTGYLDNPGAPLQDVPTFFLLEVLGEIWFWPSWARYAPPESEEVDYRFEDVPTGGKMIEVIPLFYWPETGSSALDGLHFFGAMLDGAMTEIRGEMAEEEWGYGP